MLKTITITLAIMGLFWLAATMSEADAKHCATQKKVSYDNCIYALQR